jgi:hypothetical protein
VGRLILSGIQELIFEELGLGHHALIDPIYSAPSLL